MRMIGEELKTNEGVFVFRFKPSNNEQIPAIQMSCKDFRLSLNGGGAGGSRTRVQTGKPYAFYTLIPVFGFRVAARPGPPIDTLSSEFHRAAEAQHDYFRFTCTAEPSDSEQHPWSDVSSSYLVRR